MLFFFFLQKKKKTTKKHLFTSTENLNGTQRMGLSFLHLLTFSMDSSALLREVSKGFPLQIRKEDSFS